MSQDKRGFNWHVFIEWAEEKPSSWELPGERCGWEGFPGGASGEEPACQCTELNMIDAT